MATQTKADRQEAAQKAAATRKRNETRDNSRDAGRKGAATRHQNDAVKAVKKARKEFGTAFSHVGNASKSTRDATVSAGKSVTTRVGIGPSD